LCGSSNGELRSRPETHRRGLALLQSEPNAAEAFQFMNRAMWQQRIHSIYAEQKRQSKDVELESLDIPKTALGVRFSLPLFS
jgi:hypothetical protein